MIKMKSVDIGTFSPLYDRLVVQRLEEDINTSGLYVPDVAREKPQRGVVLAVGEGYWVRGEIKPLMVKEGDEVLFSKYGGMETRINGEEVVILKEDEVLGVF